MNWKLIFLLSLFGLAMGFLTVWVVPGNIEPFFWLLIFIISAIAIARAAPGKFFLHGFLVSIINGVWITAVHLFFFSRYADAHPESMAMFNGMPAEIAAHPRRMMLVIGPIAAIISGIILGLFSWIASKIIKR